MSEIILISPSLHSGWAFSGLLADGRECTFYPFLLTATICYVCDGEEELFGENGRLMKSVKPCFGVGPLSIANLRHTTSRIQQNLHRALVHTWTHFSKTLLQMFFLELFKFKNTYKRLTLASLLVLPDMCYTSKRHVLHFMTSATLHYVSWKKCLTQTRIFLKVFKIHSKMFQQKGK